MKSKKPVIKIDFNGEKNRIGSTLIARCIYNSLKECGYNIKFEFSEDDIANFGKERLEEVVYDVETTFEYLKTLGEPRADVVLKINKMI